MTAKKDSASIFAQLASIDVHPYLEKKGKFSYLSWPFAVSEFQKAADDADWEVRHFPLPDHPHVLAPYCITPAGCFVEVTAIAGGKRRTQVHPVLDNNNRTVKAPDAFQVNTSIQRCLVKAIALHGLGLNVFAGEDLPMGDAGRQQEQPEHEDYVTEGQKAEIKNLGLHMLKMTQPALLAFCGGNWPQTYEEADAVITRLYAKRDAEMKAAQGGGR